MPEYVRIKDPATGHHLTVTRDQYEAFGGELLKQDATDPHGRPLPPKYYRSREAGDTTTASKE